jgi:hypothetical protein
MAGDLEDFLRRAAERRQAKVAQQQQQQAAPPQRQPPQYSDRRSERLTRLPNDDDIVIAEDSEESPLNSYAEQLQRVEDSRREAARLQAEVSRKSKVAAAAAQQIEAKAAANKPTGQPALDLIRLMRNPGGIQQAILLREIFERPTHRW